MCVRLSFFFFWHVGEWPWLMFKVDRKWERENVYVLCQETWYKPLKSQHPLRFFYSIRWDPKLWFEKTLCVCVCELVFQNSGLSSIYIFHSECIECPCEHTWTLIWVWMYVAHLMCSNQHLLYSSRMTARTFQWIWYTCITFLYLLLRIFVADILNPSAIKPYIAMVPGSLVYNI